MASNPGGNGAPPPLDPNQKTLNVWSKPVGEQDAANPNRQPTIADAVSTIKAEDFKNVANTPCARNGLLTGIASGFGVGGLRFILSGTSSSSLAMVWAASLEVFRPRHGLRQSLLVDVTDSGGNRQDRKVDQLGSWILRSGQRCLIRVLPVPTSVREERDEAAHRSYQRGQERTSQETS